MAVCSYYLTPVRNQHTDYCYIYYPRTWKNGHYEGERCVKFDLVLYQGKLWVVLKGNSGPYKDNPQIAITCGFLDEKKNTSQIIKYPCISSVQFISHSKISSIPFIGSNASPKPSGKQGKSQSLNHLSFHLSISPFLVDDQLYIVPAVQCQGMTKQGNQCRCKTKNPNGLCHNHQNQQTRPIVYENRLASAAQC